jgi:serine/threonine-protein kinase RIO1
MSVMVALSVYDSKVKEAKAQAAEMEAEYIASEIERRSAGRRRRTETSLNTRYRFDCSRRCGAEQKIFERA